MYVHKVSPKVSFSTYSTVGWVEGVIVNPTSYDASFIL